MRYAETGFVLEVDLTRGNIERVATDRSLIALHLGGEGTAAKELWDRVPPEVDPFSPKNLLIFSAGLLHGTPVPGASRTTVSTISPQTNLYVSAGFEGSFGPELKHAGYDKIIVSGKSITPVYLWIHDDLVELRDAGHLRGKSARETSALIRDELQDANFQVAAIGLAGENRVYQATIDHANSSASRGVGVVMGEKGLKAIAVRGTKDIKVARPAELFEMCKLQYREIHDNPHCGDVLLREADDAWHVLNLGWGNMRGRVRGYWSKDLEAEWSVRVVSDHIRYQWENYSQQMEEVPEKLVDESKRLRGTGCFNCMKNCHEAVHLPAARKYFMKNYGKLAYAMAAYHDLKLNYDTLYAMQEYGVDEFAMPQLLEFVGDLHQAGVLTDEDLPAFPADGAERLSYLVEKIARREGVGDALANGVHLAARQIGKGAEAYDRSIKKIEQAPLKPAMGERPHFLMYATGGKMDITQIEGSFPQMPIPDQAQRSELVAHWDAAPENFKTWFRQWEPEQRLSMEAAVDIADWNEAMHSIDDALGICPLLSSFRGQFGARPPYHLYNLPRFISLATGLDIDADGLLEVSGRNRHLVRAINAGRGLRRADEKAPEGLWNMDESETEELLDAYYHFRGWNSDGIPGKETLEQAGLSYVSEDLIKRGILADN